MSLQNLEFTEFIVKEKNIPVDKHNAIFIFYFAINVSISVLLAPAGKTIRIRLKLLLKLFLKKI